MTALCVDIGCGKPAVLDIRYVRNEDDEHGAGTYAGESYCSWRCLARDAQRQLRLGMKK